MEPSLTLLWFTFGTRLLTRTQIINLRLDIVSTISMQSGRVGTIDRSVGWESKGVSSRDGCFETTVINNDYQNLVHL